MSFKRNEPLLTISSSFKTNRLSCEQNRFRLDCVHTFCTDKQKLLGGRSGNTESLEKRVEFVERGNGHEGNSCDGGREVHAVRVIEDRRTIEG